MPVTNAEYAEFVTAGHAPAPTIDEAAWVAQKFAQDYETQVKRFNWIDGRPPPKREDHPVLLVTHDEATRYCAWRGKRRLPTNEEYEKAARGDSGMVYPWGNVYEAAKLNSGVAGPGDTMPVGSFPEGASPYGVLELAGNVFQWTSSPAPKERGEMLVKGSAWEDFGGVGRGASFHGRKPTIRHAIIGFRCAADANR
jgi:formylglycine-generating enzyme required for sulfatase activity